MTLNPKIEVFMDFWRFRAAIHISRANCAEINWDNRREVTYEIFSIEHRFWWSKFRLSRFREICARGHRRAVLPQKSLYYRC